jgi:uncharacterized membrane protein
MRPFLLIPLCLLLLLLVPIYSANCQNLVQYKIQINTDTSATWTVTQVSDINSSLDTWIGFQQRIQTLINTAGNSTGRTMAVDISSLQMQISQETQSRITQYIFTWENFSKVQNGKLLIGDVFAVTNFFSLLYGEGTLELVYPPSYSVMSVFPRPYSQDNTTQTLEWLGTQDFVNEKPSITLKIGSQNQNGSGRQQNEVLILSLTAAAAVAISLAGFYILRRSKRRRKKTLTNAAALTSSIESEEQKIINVIQSAGGSLNQTAIVEQCKFSKAKTSQLLTDLEQKGMVTRYKKGRDKIVTLVQKNNR